VLNIECFGAQTEVWSLFKDDIWQIIADVIMFIIKPQNTIFLNMFYSKTEKMKAMNLNRFEPDIS